MWRYGDRLRKILDRYPGDFGKVYQYALMLEDPRYRAGTVKDEWGCVWRNLPGRIIGQVVAHSLENWSSFDEYVFPEPSDDPMFDKVDKFIQQKGHEKYILVDYCSYFKRMQRLRGFSNLMVDLMTKRRELERLADKLLDYNLKRIKRWGEMDIDGIVFGDD